MTPQLSTSAFLLLRTIYFAGEPYRLRLTELQFSSELIKAKLITRQKIPGNSRDESPFICDLTDSGREFSERFEHPITEHFYLLGKRFTIAYTEDIAPYQKGDYVLFSSKWKFWTSPAAARAVLTQWRNNSDPNVNKYFKAADVLAVDFDLPKNGKSLDLMFNIHTIEVNPS